MSDQTPQTNPQQTLVIALVVVAVLLAAIVGLLVYQQSHPTTAAVDTGTVGTAPTGTTTGTAPSTTTGNVAFDSKTATKVPSGVTPETYVKDYNEAILAGKFDVAFKMLPLATQQSYGDATSYGQTVSGYGITGYKVGKATTSGDTISVIAEQDTPQMNITYTWNFKKVGKTLYMQSRVMGGSLQ